MRLVRPRGARPYLRAACPRIGNPAVGGPYASVAGRRIPTLPGAGECVLARAAEVHRRGHSIRSPFMSLMSAATRFVKRAPLPDALSKLGVAALVDRASRS